MKFKHLLFALFAPLFTATTFAQTQPTVVADSTYIVRKDKAFVQRTVQLYDNGEIAQPAGLVLGDTAQAASFYSQFFVSTADRYAGDIRIIQGYRRGITELIRFGKVVATSIGVNPLDTIIRKENNLLTASYWQVTRGATATGINFRIANNGNFQWKADTSSVWRAAGFLGSVLRLNLFNGYTQDFVKSANGKAFISMSQQYRIQPIGQARDLSDIQDPEPLTPPQPELKPEFLTGGVVRYGELKYKYNTKTKKWETL